MLLPQRDNPLFGKGFDDAYTVTASGHRFYYARFQPSDILFEDIATGLSFGCRWLGALNCHLSIATHSTTMAYWALVCRKTSLPKVMQYEDDEVDKIVRKEFAKALFFHDSEEYVTGDFPSPLKQFFNPLFEDYASYVRETIYLKYNAHYPYYKHVKEWDRKMLFAEAHRFLVGGVNAVRDEGTVAQTLGCSVQARDPQKSREEFRSMYLRLI